MKVYSEDDVINLFDKVWHQITDMFCSQYTLNLIGVLLEAIIAVFEKEQ